MNRFSHTMSDYSSFRSPRRLFKQCAPCTGRRLDSLLFTRCAARWAAGTPPVRRGPISLLRRRCSSESQDHSVSRSVGIKFTSAHSLRKIIQPSFAIQLELCAQLAECDALHLTSGARHTAFLGAPGI